MTTPKRSAVDIERALIDDADRPAWEDPITVQASSAPRPTQYGGARGRPPQAQIIGEIAVAFGNLELWLEVALWQLLTPSDHKQQELMQAITVEMSFDRKVHAFASVFKLKFPAEEEDAELASLVKELFKAQEERNAILHSAWSSSDGSATFVRMKASAKAKRGLTRRVYPAGEDLAAIRGHIAAVGQRFGHFMMTRVQEQPSQHLTPAN
jgi:hypothetical protein